MSKVGTLAFLGVKNRVSNEISSNTVKASTHYNQNIAQLKGQLTVDQFSSYDSAVGLIKEKPMSRINEFKATEQVAKALKGAPRDSITKIVERTLAALAKK